MEACEGSGGNDGHVVDVAVSNGRQTLEEVAR